MTKELSSRSTSEFELGEGLKRITIECMSSLQANGTIIYS